MPLTEIVSKNEFFDYEAKYNEDFADEITPAPIPEAVEIDCKCISSDLYSKLNCKGIVRFDYIYSDNALYFLEVNTIPGFSEKSSSFIIFSISSVSLPLPVFIRILSFAHIFGEPGRELRSSSSKETSPLPPEPALPREP